MLEKFLIRGFTFYLKMNIKVRVHAGTKQEKVVKISEGFYEVWLYERAIDGKANRGLCQALKKEFGCACKVVRGFKGVYKIVEFKE